MSEQTPDIQLDISGNNTQSTKPEVEEKNRTFSKIASIIKDREETKRNMDTLYQLNEIMSEKLVDQEQELRRKREEEQIENKKHAMKLELECLEIENMKMDAYLKTLSKKHELEILYLNEVCAQKQKIADLSNNHPEVNFGEIQSYNEFYRQELNNVASVKSTLSENKDINVSSSRANDTNNKNPTQNVPRPTLVKSTSDTIKVNRRQSTGAMDLQSSIRDALETKFKKVNLNNDSDDWETS